MKAPKYTYFEVESIAKEYDEQVPLKVIAENANLEFHNNKPVRNAKSVSYVIGRLNADDGWFERLEREMEAVLDA